MLLEGVKKGTELMLYYHLAFDESSADGRADEGQEAAGEADGSELYVERKNAERRKTRALARRETGGNRAVGERVLNVHRVGYTVVRLMIRCTG